MRGLNARSAAIALGWTLTLAACAGADITSEAAYSLISVPTQEPAPPGTPPACPAALITGRLVADARWGIALDDPAGFVREVIWPHGYTARRDARLVVLNESGQIVAGEGDLLAIGGGEVNSDGAWLACGGISVIQDD
jgi:hypothetical protein